MQTYAGLRVLDFGQGVAAPYCGTLLAQHGADVVKVEPPAGDWSRSLGHRTPDMSVLCATFNRGKRSIVLDFAQPAGRETALALATRADVVIESFRPGVMARHGLAYADLQPRNPALIYLSVSGFGQTGPYAARPATDTVSQVFAGLAHENRGADGVPHRVGVLASDVVTGLYAFSAVQAALTLREREGGRHLDLDLAQGTAALLSFNVADASMGGASTPPRNVPSGMYATQDGWISISLIKEKHFAGLCAAASRPDLAADPRYATIAGRTGHDTVLTAAFRAVFAAGTTAHWLTRLQAADVLAERLNSPADLLTDPHMQARGGIARFDQPGLGPMAVPATPGWLQAAPQRPAPLLGDTAAMALWS